MQDDHKPAQTAVYLTRDIADLLNCKPRQINRYIDAGIIPPPIGDDNKPGKRRRWLKRDVDAALGIVQDQEQIREVVLSELRRLSA